MDGHPARDATFLLAFAKNGGIILGGVDGRWGNYTALTPCVQFVCYFYIALFGALPLPLPPFSIPLPYSICSI